MLKAESRLRTIISSVLLIFCVFLCTRFAKAQYTTASLGGTVVDASGAVIPESKVTAKSTGTGLTRSTASRADGSFLFPALPVGTYTLTVEKAGFSTYVQQGITLTVNEAASQRVVLKVGTVSQQVTVSANASMLNTHTATTGQLINQQEVVDLPLNGRTPESLLFLAPGTANTTNLYCVYNCQGGVYPSEQEAQINGAGPGNVNYEMDGAGHTDTYMNINLPFPNPDAVQEFSLQNGNMSAVYGNAADVVNIVTKSGTNQFHGDAFEFVRNGDLNARNFFAPVEDTLKRNQFGGTIGGPIKKDKLFFFGTYQGTRVVSAAAGEVHLVPTQAERNGDFSAISTQVVDPVTGLPFPNNQIPTSRFSAPAVAMLQHIPLPNGPNGQLTFLGPELVEHDDQWMAKGDYIRGKNQFSARYFFSNFNEPADIAAGERNLLAMDGCANAVRVQTLALSDTYSASPTLLFNTWFGWDQQVGGSRTGAAASFASYGISIAAPQVPQQDGLNVGGYFNFASGHFGDFNRGDKRFREVITKEKGAHEISLGGDIIRINQNISNTNTQGGSFNFTNAFSGNNLTDLFLGQATRFIQGGGQYQNYLGTVDNLFINDNWRVNQKLSFNLGVRWDPFWPYRELKDRIHCFVPGSKSTRYPNAPVGYIFGGDTGCPAGSGYYSNLNNIAPRLGFAYRLGHHTVLRGGAGIYYTIPETAQYSGIASTSPFAPRFNLSDVSFANPYASAGIVNPFPADFGGVVPGPSATFVVPFTIPNTYQTDYRIDRMGNWNFTLDHQFGSNWMASIAFVGNMGWNLGSDEEGEQQLNPGIYIPGASTEANLQSRRRYTDFTAINEFVSAYNSNYNALQLNVQKRFSHGLTVLANYTWAHQMDNYPPTNCVGTDPFDRDFDWGNSLDNIPNIFHLTEVWQVPHFARLHGVAGAVLNGWEVSSLTSWQNGFPFTIFSGVDNSFSGEFLDRADFTGTSLGQAVLGDRPHGQMVNEYFNTSVFGVNAIGTFGNAGKNLLEGPGFFDTDIGLIKNTRITERTSVQFRAEFFNLFNSVNLMQPGNTVGSGSFGHIFSAGSPRILQFALKFIF
ncbi:MAG: carboxypeptidase regulatory-like domain-containing protein [Terriglobia bacterium]